MRGVGREGVELTTSRVDFPSFSTDLAQIRKVGFFLTKMKIGEVRFHFTTPLRTLFEGGLGGRGFELTTSRVDFPFLGH